MKPILSSSFRYDDAPLLFSKARLFEDRIVLTGWGFKGRHKRVIHLNEIKEVDWWFGRAEVNFALNLNSGPPVSMYLKGAGNWKYTIEELLGKSPDITQGVLPDEQLEQNDAAADQSKMLIL